MIMEVRLCFEVKKTFCDMLVDVKHKQSLSASTSRKSRLSADSDTDSESILQSLLAQIVNTDKSPVSINIANVTKQSGSEDCCRLHHSHCIWTKSLFVCVSAELYEGVSGMEPFPVQKDQRLPMARKIVQIQVYCYCYCLDNGEGIITCDGECGEWLHAECVYSTVHRNKKWLCNNCVIQSHHT